MDTRTLTNVGDPITTPDGVVLAGVLITITLVNIVNKKGIIFDPTTGEMVSGTVDVVTDVNGEFTVDLVPNDSLSPQTEYHCKVSGVGEFQAFLEGGSTPKKWVDFFLRR